MIAGNNLLLLRGNIFFFPQPSQGPWMGLKIKLTD